MTRPTPQQLEDQAFKLALSLYGSFTPDPMSPLSPEEQSFRWRYRTLEEIDDLREQAHYARIAVQNSIDHIRSYYGLEVFVGLRVTKGGRPAAIVGFSGQYIDVLVDGEEGPITCHATADLEYPRGVRVGPGPDERFAHLVQVP